MTEGDLTRATLLAWTVQRMPSPGFPKDRVIALVEFEDGGRAFALADSEVGLGIGGSGTVADGPPPRYVPARDA